MDWKLEIHAIDVGRGDSTLIIAKDTDPHGRSTSMLIDAGLAGLALYVHQFVRATLAAEALQGLDAILVSHYDEDHSDGVVHLLLADNLWHLCNAIAQVAVPTLPAGTRQQQIARAAARAGAAVLGAWGRYSGQADAPGNAAAGSVPAGASDDQAASSGFQVAQRYGLNPGYSADSLVPSDNLRSAVCRAGGIAAARAMAFPGAPVAVADVQAAVRAVVFGILRPQVPANANFDTGGIYRNTRIIDVGSAGTPPPNYVQAAGDQVKINNVWVDVPGLNRRVCSIPALGTELLWAPAAPPDQVAPVAIVVSTPDKTATTPTGTAWRGAGQFQRFSGDQANCLSIGIVLVFRDFTYFSAGDLPSQGEDLIGPALRNRQLPDGRNGFRAAPLPRIDKLHVSHHGAAVSTSYAFLANILPLTAMISCGQHGGYEHPTQEVIDRLAGAGNVIATYLTNCNYQRNHVPRTNGINQLVGVPNNRMWVAGDNILPNTQAGRHRGDIKLLIRQAWAVPGPPGAPNYQISYWENDLPVPGQHTVTWQW